MEKDKIKAIAKEKGVKDVTLFVEFISKRFPHESNEITYYVREWANRFNSGNPEKYMDALSLEIYNDIKVGLNCLVGF